MAEKRVAEGKVQPSGELQVTPPNDLGVPSPSAPAQAPLPGECPRVWSGAALSSARSVPSLADGRFTVVQRLKTALGLLEREQVQRQVLRGWVRWVLRHPPLPPCRPGPSILASSSAPSCRGSPGTVAGQGGERGAVGGASALGEGGGYKGRGEGVRCVLTASTTSAVRSLVCPSREEGVVECCRSVTDKGGEEAGRRVQDPLGPSVGVGEQETLGEVRAGCARVCVGEWHHWVLCVLHRDGCLEGPQRCPAWGCPWGCGRRRLRGGASSGPSGTACGSEWSPQPVLFELVPEVCPSPSLVPLPSLARCLQPLPWPCSGYNRQPRASPSAQHSCSAQLREPHWTR